MKFSNFLSSLNAATDRMDRETENIRDERAALIAGKPLFTVMDGETVVRTNLLYDEAKKMAVRVPGRTIAAQ